MGAKYVFNPLTGNLDTTDVVAFNGEVNLGTAAAPSVFFTGDTNTGIYSPGADQLAISTNGTEKLRITSDGKVGIGTTSPGSALEIDAAAATSPFIAKINTNEAARIDSSGRLLIGMSTSVDTGSSVQIARDTNNFHLELVEGNNAVGEGPAIYLARARGSVASPTEVSSGDTLGYVVFRGYDGSTYQNAAWIKAEADGTWTDGGDTTDNPGRLVFSTTADGASTPTERMRITSDAYVRLASGTGGIQFNGDTAAANALDDYEEGTFTPTITGTTTAGTGTYSVQIGRYVKIGKQVTVWIRLTWSAHTGTGDSRIAGLPFASQVIGGGHHPFAATVGYEIDYDVAANTVLSAFVEPNAATIRLAQIGVGTQSGASNAALDTAAGVSISATYETA